MKEHLVDQWSPEFIYKARGQAFSPSFDCAKTSHPVEHAICADPVLAELDAAPNKDALRSGQRQWLKQRRQCAQRADISRYFERHYRERLSQL